MRSASILFAVAALLAAFSAPAQAQELLTNGGLELVFPDMGGRDSVPPGWTMSEGPPVPANPNAFAPGDYNDDGNVDAADYVVWRHGGPLLNEDASFGSVDAADYEVWRAQFGGPRKLSLAEPANFSHLLFEGDWHMWFQPYLGTEAEQEDNFAHLTQTVPGTPGLSYTMRGNALFEDYFPGGVTNLNMVTNHGQPTGAPFDDGPPSPTDTFFALEFLDAGGTVLPGSPVIELKAAGQLSNTMWQEHVLNAVAPAGTTNVRVRATMLDGVYNPLPSPQVFKMSFFVDAFSLTAAPPGSGAGAVPEPAAWLLAILAAAACSLAPPRRATPE